MSQIDVSNSLASDDLTEYGQNLAAGIRNSGASVGGGQYTSLQSGLSNEGYSVTYTDTTMTDTLADFTPSALIGSVIRAGASGELTMLITANTSTTITGSGGWGPSTPENGALYFTGALPTVTGGAALDGGVVSVADRSTDVSGVVNMTQGGTPATGVAVTVTFNTPYLVAPNTVTITPASADAAADWPLIQPWVSSITAENFVVSLTAAGTATNTDNFYYVVVS